MYELQDKNGRLIVVMPFREKHYGRSVCVFVNGKCVGEHKSFGEAAKHARALAESEKSDLPNSAV
jgi:hypothetical protein